MSYILLLGGNELHSGLQDWAKNHNVEKIVVMDWNEKPDFTGDIHIRADIKDTKKALSIIDKYGRNELLLCYTSADIGILTQKAVHDYCGLNTADLDLLENTIYKNRMTSIWKKHGLLNRFSEVVESLENLNFPSYVNDVIVKPNASSGSRGITIIKQVRNNIQLLSSAIDLAQSESRDNLAIVEEFVYGIEYTVEMLGDKYGNVRTYGVAQKYHTSYLKSNKVAIKLHYNPANMSEKLIDKISDFGQKCYRALELNNSMGHLEIVVSKDGRMCPLEIGARSTGFVASHLLDSINESSFLLDYAAVLRNERVKSGRSNLIDKSAMYFFYDIPPCISKNNVSFMSYVPDGIISVQWNRDKIRKDTKYETITQDAYRLGYEILTGARSVLTIDNINKAEESFLNDFCGKKSIFFNE